MVPSASAAGSSAMGPEAATFNMSIAYGITSAAALLLAVGYWSLVKKKNTWLQLLFVSVVIVNCGYLTLSISRTLEEALLANRISYFGSVFLPLCMLMTIMDVCRVNYSKKLPAVLLAISVAVFLLAASPGYLDCYYRDVSLVFINGMAKLEKVYGPLHSVYLIYLLSYMGLMVGAILTSRVKKKNVSQKHAILLMVVTFLNIAIWGVEQLVYTQFELLSVSYIASELLLLLLYSMMQDYGILSDTPIIPAVDAPSGETAAANSLCADEEEEAPNSLDETQISALVEQWTQEYALTHREAQVLIALLQDRRRKEIAADLNVTEHTIKKHTGNIFSKMGVASRAELFALAEQT
jgi:DNA-binding CsgD family transcriptional regulator